MDRIAQEAVLYAAEEFPDAEFMARTQCAFLNESPVMQATDCES